MAEKTKPEPCPFCADDRVSVEGAAGLWWVFCGNPFCGASGPDRRTRRDAIERWNDAPRDRSLVSSDAR
ncbi:Lar family restriction alleviation protein [Longimicrobium sp.]|uniref:Lar family restriction alleviation protein n=1 Tax=Longimicrobium sp. TaxID=2029185 RepID=UPI0039C99672